MNYLEAIGRLKIHAYFKNWIKLFASNNLDCMVNISQTKYSHY